MAEGAKKTYKPRVGKANVNMDKYSKPLFDLIVNECGDMLKNLGFYYLMDQADSDSFKEEGQIKWI